jgi:hypothetical protein
MFHPFSIKVRHLARPHLLRHVPGSVDFFENMCLLQNIFLYDIISSFYRLENIGKRLFSSKYSRSLSIGWYPRIGWCYPYFEAGSPLRFNTPTVDGSSWLMALPQKRGCKANVPTLLPSSNHTWQ